MSARESITELEPPLWFRVQKLRTRRHARGLATWPQLLGPKGFAVLSAESVRALSDPAQLEVFCHLLANAADPDIFEKCANELLEYSDQNGEGACISVGPPTSHVWIPLRSIATLDSYDRCDGLTVHALLWETYKISFRPTSAGSGTNAGTGPAASTSPDAKQQSSEPSSSKPSTPKSGNRPPRTRAASGVFIG